MSQSFPSETTIKSVHYNAFIGSIRDSLLSPQAAALEPIPYWMSPETQRRLAKEFEEMGYVVALIGEHGTQKMSVRLQPS